MAVRGIAGDEDAADAVLIGDREAQVPEADVLELDVEFVADRLMQEAAEIEIVFCGAERHRRVKEPGGAEIDAAEELPVALQVGMQHIVEGLVGKALQQLVQAGRAEHQQHHQPVVIGQGLRNAGGLAHQRAAAVAADHIVCPQHALPIAVALGDRHLHAVGVLRDAGSAPAINCFDVRQLTQALPQHGLGGVLRQPFVVGEVIGPHQLALEPVIPVAAQQRAVGRHAADAVVGRDRPRRPKLRLRAPEVKVLERALGQVLTLRDRLRADVALDQNAADAALAEVDRKTKTNRPASDNDDLRG